MPNQPSMALRFQIADALVPAIPDQARQHGVERRVDRRVRDEIGLSIGFMKSRRRADDTDPHRRPFREKRRGGAGSVKGRQGLQIKERRAAIL